MLADLDCAMWPWGHLAIGYLIYSPWVRVRTGSKPQALPIVLLAIGTQLPDLVDKPLAYWLAVLPEGRSLAHSYLVIIPVCILLYVILKRLEQPEAGIGFTVGLVTHPVGDGLTALVTGEWSQLTYVVWPILPLPDYEAGSFIHHLRDLVALTQDFSIVSLINPFGGGLFVVEVWLTILLTTMWILDGAPPLQQLFIQVRSRGGATKS